MSESERQAGAEIEVTEEMIEAGVNALMGYEITEGCTATWKAAVEAAFRKMAQVQRS